jgi:cytochrome c-type biogenesis protein CcmH/NrfF
MSHRALPWPRAVGTVFLALQLLLLATPVWGAESAEEQARRSQDIARTTMSPFCPGRTIDACPSEYATQWREDVRAWVGEGVSTEDIRKRLKERSDHDLTGAPSTALDSVMPILVVVISGLLLALLLRALLKPGKGTGDAKPKAASTDRSALDARLDDELSSLDD